MNSTRIIRSLSLSAVALAVMAIAPTSQAAQSNVMDAVRSSSPGLAAVIDTVVNGGNSQGRAAPAAVAPAPKSAAALAALGNRRAALDGELPRRAKAGSGVVGDLDPAVVSAPVVSLTLADGSTIQARLQRVATDSKHGAQSWVGTFDDSPGSVLALTKSGGSISGYATYRNQTLEIVPGAGGKHLLYAVDTAQLPKSDGVIKAGGGAGDALVVNGAQVDAASNLAAGSTVVQDLLVVYTAASASAWGKATIESMIQSAVQSANQAYVNSQVAVSLNVVGLQQVSMTESGSGMQATLNALKTNSEVKNLRDTLGADMVVLVSQDSDWCGYANLTITTWNGVTTTDAYAVAYSSCLSSQTLAHEVGHLQGLDHDRANSTGSSAFYPYSYGYRMCTGGSFKDIMSYPCSPDVPRLLQFSNPALNYNGYATGIDYAVSPSTAADAARSLNESAAQVAAYKASVNASPTAPATPTGLYAASVLYNGVTVAWTDNASNETGYKVERSPDGVNYLEIASLGAGVTSFADAAVVASSKYFYRVRAWNNVGNSSYSNVVSVATPAPPPPPPAAPSAVTAANQANGYAAVSWSSAASNATSFEVRRETYDARKKTWGRSTLVATVPSSVLSISDASGTGTYRYFVRAVNSGGKSAEAGPAQVAVTNVSSSSPKKVR